MSDLRWQKLGKNWKQLVSCIAMNSDDIICHSQNLRNIEKQIIFPIIKWCGICEDFHYVFSPSLWNKQINKDKKKYPPPSLTARPWKMDGWKTILFLLRLGPFSGAIVPTSNLSGQGSFVSSKTFKPFLCTCCRWVNPGGKVCFLETKYKSSGRFSWCEELQGFFGDDLIGLSWVLCLFGERLGSLGYICVTFTVRE